MSREIEGFTVPHHKVIWTSIRQIEENVLGENYLQRLKEENDSSLKIDFIKILF